MRVAMIAGAMMLAALPGMAPAQVPASPYDTNPSCTERTTDSNAPECVVKQEGEPRRTYPPPRDKVTPPPPPPPPPGPAASPPLSPPRSGTGGLLR